MENQILCPKCYSNQITTSKKGFSGTKAVAGAIATGGIGLLAGTIGSNKIEIICLSCGHKFKPGEGAKEEPLKVDLSKYKEVTIGLIKEQGELSAINHLHKHAGLSQREAYDFVKSLIQNEKIQPKSGCAAIIALIVLLSFYTIYIYG